MITEVNDINGLGSDFAEKADAYSKKINGSLSDEEKAERAKKSREPNVSEALTLYEEEKPAQTQYKTRWGN